MEVGAGREPGRADLADHLAGRDRIAADQGPNKDSGNADCRNPQQPHHAWATACSTALKPVLSADSSLCAAFSAPPIAPGTLNTTSSAASAKRWCTGV